MKKFLVLVLFGLFFYVGSARASVTAQQLSFCVNPDSTGLAFGSIIVNGIASTTELPSVTFPLSPPPFTAAYFAAGTSQQQTFGTNLANGFALVLAQWKTLYGISP